MKTGRLTAIVFLCLLLGACYTRQPLATPVPAPTERIIATVTDTGAVVMGNTIGTGAMQVEGIVTEASETSWTLRMLRVDHRDGRSVPWNRETVNFPVAALSDPSAVVLNRQRSWLFAGGVFVGALIVGRMFNVLGTSEDDRNPGEEPQQILVPAGRR